MGFNEKTGPEPGLYETNSGSQQGSVTDLVTVSSRWQWLHDLSGKLGAETVGCEQLPEEARDVNQKPWSTFFVWSTANFHYSGMTTGCLGPLAYGLGWWDSFAVIMCFNFLGVLSPSVISYLGPQLGMRTMIITRYSFGYWAAKGAVLLNAIACIGWVVVNTVAASGLLYDATDTKLPIIASICLIIFTSLVICFLGYRAIHIYDRYGALFVLLLSLILISFGGPHFTNAPVATGAASRTGILSFGAVIFAWAIAWVPLTADYSLYMPSSTPKWQTFLFTFIGIYGGSTLAFLIGLAFATLTSNLNPAYDFPGVFADRGIGGLIGAVFDGHGTAVRGFGRFVQVCLALSITGANIPTIYSFGIAVQAISIWTQRIPRVLVTLFGAGAALTVSCIVRDHFLEALENFVNVLSYWCTPYAAVVLGEHFIFRTAGRRGYDVSVWDTPSLLPPGIAAAVTWACGLTAALLGANQTWLVGPVAKAIGGADVGWELAAAVGLVVYIPTRWLELRVFGR